MGFPLSSSIRRADRVIWYRLPREIKEKGNDGFVVVLGVGDEIMMLDPKKFEERNEFGAVAAITALLLLLLRRDWDEAKFELSFERKIGYK